MMLLPFYGVAERIPSMRAGALRLGLVTLDQMISTLVRAVENPPALGTTRIVSAPEIQKFRVARLEEGYEKLGSVVKHFRGNGDCWMHAMVARGAVDAVVEFSLNRWDIAATEVIVEEAGGRFYTRPSKTVQGKFDVVFGSPAAADEIVELLSFEPS